MKRVYNVFILLAIVPVLISGCAGSTPYQSAGRDGYGYSSDRVQDNRYVVHIILNPHTPLSTARIYWARRVKELCGCEEAVPSKASGECFREISYHESPGSPAEIEPTQEYDRYGNSTLRGKTVVPASDTTAQGEVECLKKGK